jgi:hypothetical protein
MLDLVNFIFHLSDLDIFGDITVQSQYVTVNTHDTASYNFFQTIMSYSKVWTPMHLNTESHLKIF